MIAQVIGAPRQVGPAHTDEQSVWQSDVHAWPESVDHPYGDSDLDSAGVRLLLDSAMVTELNGLATGDRLRVVTTFDSSSSSSSFYLFGAAPSRLRPNASTVVECDKWASAHGPVPEMGHSPITGIRAVIGGIAAPWPTAVQSANGLEMWANIAEDLAYTRLPIAIVVEIERRAAPSKADDARYALLARADLQKAKRRSGVSREPVPDQRNTVAGNFSVRVGIVGDIATFEAVWRNRTGTALQRVEAGARPNFYDLVDATTAVALIPIPVLSEGSRVAVRRARPLTTALAPFESSEPSLVVAVDGGGNHICLDPHKLNRHLLVTGDQGTGKSITTMAILRSLWNRFGIPWIVIDPSKAEYAALTVSRGGSTAAPVRHLQLGQVPINPFAVPNGVDPLVMASAMAQAFSSATDLGEAFPLGAAVARAAFNDLYGRVQATGTQPTIADLESALNAASHASGFLGENARNIRVSLLSRVRSLSSGVVGNAFSGGPRAGINWGELSNWPTVLTFPAGLSPQDLSVMYAMLVAGHSAWRSANPTTEGHVMVLEEIHQVFGRSNPQGAQTLETLLATMRASGQGYFAVTQTPHQLSEQSQRLFQNVVTHRIAYAWDLPLVDVLGVSPTHVSRLEDRQVIARLNAPKGTRGRVPQFQDLAVQDPLRRRPAFRVEEFVIAGPTLRGWCSACPAPCSGRSWLRFAEGAAQTVLSQGARVDPAHAAAMAVASVRQQGSAANWPENLGGVYCASARGATVALSALGATEAESRAACAHAAQVINHGGTGA